MNAKTYDNQDLTNLIQKAFVHLAHYAEKTTSPLQTEARKAPAQKKRKFLTQDELKSIVETSLKIQEELSQNS